MIIDQEMCVRRVGIPGRNQSSIVSAVVTFGQHTSKVSRPGAADQQAQARAKAAFLAVVSRKAAARYRMSRLRRPPSEALKLEARDRPTRAGD
jgi:hypothetical protein